jgi:hypothetical protein
MNVFVVYRYNKPEDEQIPTDLPGLDGGQQQINLLLLREDIMLQVLPLPPERGHPHRRHPLANPPAHNQELLHRRRRKLPSTQ